jgi:hypothetical protein
MPGVFAEHAGRKLVVRVGPGIEILDEQLLKLGERQEIPEQQLEVLFRHRLGVFPPDRRIGLCIAHDELVLH